MDARRLNWIGDMEIVDLLREEASFVVADVGHPLRWIQVADRFTFWKKEVQPHLAPPDTVGFYPDDYPGEYCYVASLWKCGSSAAVILLEKLH
jgi:hypothetical protein